MATLTERVQVLLSPQQLRRLRSVAGTRGESVGELIRRAVDEVYFQGERDRRRAAVRRLAALNLPVADWEQMERESDRWPADE